MATATDTRPLRFNTMMNHDLRDVVASNVNEEAVVFRGASTGELMSIATVSSVVIIPVFILVGLMIGRTTIMLSLSLVAIFIAIFALATLMQRVKRGRPDGYYQQKLILFKKRTGMGQSHFIQEHGVMSTLRTKQCVLVNKHLKQEIK